ncbi:serine/threonine-protein kinase [Streptomyces ipomoeae]|uniref:serine/threonine-protein kinase n=1 Tax=Streptomyces ipomoeae TaxID=103232 RepID=UPI0011478A45|nr:serine/threonine-protein kinase [Streptomyces ipomoeae]MDX2934479.1 protein kinase [Streptomyces ipomoeae]TQE17397.1 serine/threonine protein kinase [Streptomyces ipomoeae]
MVEPLRHGTDPGRVGPFELMGRLGSGGMGSVYLARRTGSGLLVALKTIRAELSAEPGYRERFAREIEIAHAVRSVHTAQLVDFDAEADVPWLATELVHGPNLADVLAMHGRLPDGSVRVLAASLAEALKAIHTAGIVHRDVKPSNIILAETGPRLVDFGVARPVGQVGLTSTGQFVGSVVYASPEQLLAQRVGPQSDMFSLGVVLAEASGEAVRSAQGTPLAADAVDGRTPSLPSLPPDLRTLVRKCLSRNPDGRPSPTEVPGMLAELPRPDGRGTYRWLPDSVSRSVRRSSEGLLAVTHPPTALDPQSAGAHQQPTATAYVSPGGPAPAQAPTSPIGRPGIPVPTPAAGKRLALTVALALAASLLVVTGVSLAGQDSGAGSGAGVPDSTPGTTATASAEPFGDGKPSRGGAPPPDTVTPAGTPADSVRAPSAAAPEPPTFTRGTLGVSRYQDPGYAATVTSVNASGHQLTVALRARGEADLRAADTTCLVVRGPDGTFRVRPTAWDAETARPGAFDGTLTFPLLVSGRYVLRYSCQDDYSDAELGTATVPHIGISRYSDEFFAVVLSADRTSSGLQLVFASAGDPTLRSPQTSCLNQGGAEEYPEDVRLDRSDTTLNHFHYGVMDFASGAQGSSFTYSCAGDYSAVPLP